MVGTGERQAKQERHKGHNDDEASSYHIDEILRHEYHTVVSTKWSASTCRVRLKAVSCYSNYEKRITLFLLTMRSAHDVSLRFLLCYIHLLCQKRTLSSPTLLSKIDSLCVTSLKCSRHVIIMRRCPTTIIATNLSPISKIASSTKQENLLPYSYYNHYPQQVQIIIQTGIFSSDNAPLPVWQWSIGRQIAYCFYESVDSKRRVPSLGQ